MIKKGLVKVEGLNSKTLQYIITPQGMLEKSQKTYRYIKRSYKQIIKLSNALLYIYENEEKEICFYGPKDEVLEILKISADENNIKYFYTKDFKKINKEDFVITWIPEDYEELFRKDYKVINILNYI
jgi:putative sterol carrier protein